MSNFPTIERTQKQDWEQVGKRRRRSNTLQALRSRVSDDVIADAELWVKRWNLAMNGYCDAQKNSGEPAIAGDRITFAALQAKAWKPIKDFKILVGDRRHMLLVQLLAKSRSFTSLASEWYPNYKRRQALVKIVNDCAALLTDLHAFWTKQRKESAKKKVEASRLYDQGYNIPLLCERYKMATPSMRKIIQDGKNILSKHKKVLTITAQ